jgi:hypothetical protein
MQPPLTIGSARFKRAPAPLAMVRRGAYLSLSTQTARSREPIGARDAEARSNGSRPVKGSQRPPQHDFQVGGLTVAPMGISASLVLFFS